VGESGGGWPGTFEDVAAAVDFVRVLARTVPTMDTTRVILVGHSAGGQLALWAASRANGAGAALAQPVPPIRVSGVVSLAGVTDMAAFGAQPGGCNSTIATLLGGSPSDVPERYRAVDPIQRLPIRVPVQLVLGAGDPIVPAAQGEDYARRARSIGDYVTLTSVPGAGQDR